MAAEGSQRRGRDGEDDAEEQAHKDWAKKAFERLKSLSSAMGTKELSRVAQRLSRWANPTHLQWKDVNE